ncbi:hypothetical protein N656DRAFT_195164 [Canariomyces notabilis]|uniref:Uncharacterized protein n=1 Tax=Canariomyces notabilis TaxID=2074819 RepID=A0AAN6QQS6_9PEZI|nr:hypothetical protein N656DRAFT_195164 [Canariomyces arenarius]
MILKNRIPFPIFTFSQHCCISKHQLMRSCPLYFQGPHPPATAETNRFGLQLYCIPSPSFRKLPHRQTNPGILVRITAKRPIICVRFEEDEAILIGVSHSYLTFTGSQTLVHIYSSETVWPSKKRHAARARGGEDDHDCHVGAHQPERLVCVQLVCRCHHNAEDGRGADDNAKSLKLAWLRKPEDAHGYEDERRGA